MGRDGAVVPRVGVGEVWLQLDTYYLLQAYDADANGLMELDEFSRFVCNLTLTPALAPTLAPTLALTLAITPTLALAPTPTPTPTP